MERENYQVELTPEEKAARKKRAQRKKKMRLALVVFVFVLIIGTLVGGITSIFVFRVKNYSVESESTMYDQQQIIDATGITLNKSLIFLSLDKAEKEVEEKLPFLKNVEITKKLPTGVVIRFEEAGMAYAVEVATGTYALTNDEFKVLSVSGMISDGVVPVRGQIPVVKEVGQTIAFVAQNTEDKDAPPVKDETLDVLKAIASTIAKNNFEGVTAVNVSSMFDIYLIYQDRILIELGDSKNMESKMSFFIRAIEEEDMIDDTKTGIMDFTIPETAYFCTADVRDIPELAEHLGVDLNGESGEDSQENSGENAEEITEESTENNESENSSEETETAVAED